MSVTVTKNQLYEQAANEIDTVQNLAALETQSDLLNYTMQSLLADLKAYGGSGAITLSAKTTNALAVLQQVSANSTVTDTDVSTPSTSRVVGILNNAKQATRQLQSKYYALKQQLGIN